MIRIKRGNKLQKKHKKILKLTKGFFGTHSKLFKIANLKVLKALKNAYIGRKQKKRNFKSLWLIRINALLKFYKKKYSHFKLLLKKNKIELNNKILCYLSIFDPNIIKLLLLKINN